MSSRRKVLEKIRKGLQTTASDLPLPQPLPPHLPVNDMAEAFRKGVEALGGTWKDVEQPAQALEVVRSLAQERKAESLLASRHPLVRQVLQAGSLDCAVMDAGGGPDLQEEEKAELGLAAATWGAAATATLILSADDEQTRRASLTPPVSIILLPVSGLVRDVSDFFANQAAETSRNSALILVSGPSRTGDIELTLSTGVHGPGVLHVVLCRFDAPDGGSGPRTDP